MTAGQSDESRAILTTVRELVEAGRAEMLRWWREHARLWLSIGPAGAQLLLSHATRPTRGRFGQGSD